MKRDQRYYIRQAIEICGGSQALLAAEVGVSQSTVSRWLNGMPIMTDHAIAVSEATGNSVTRKQLRGDVKW